MRVLFILFVTMIVIILAEQKNVRLTRDIEDRVKNLDVMTKRRVLAMHAAGVPPKVIADKVSYIAGRDTKKAAKMVEGIKLEDQRKQKMKTTTKKNINKNNNNNKRSRK